MRTIELDTTVGHFPRSCCDDHDRARDRGWSLEPKNDSEGVAWNGPILHRQGPGRCWWPDAEVVPTPGRGLEKDEQQGLVLYQRLGGRAWIAAEELSVTRLASEQVLGPRGGSHWASFQRLLSPLEAKAGANDPRVQHGVRQAPRKASRSWMLSS